LSFYVHIQLYTLPGTILYSVIESEKYWLKRLLSEYLLLAVDAFMSPSFRHFLWCCRNSYS